MRTANNIANARGLTRTIKPTVRAGTAADLLELLEDADAEAAEAVFAATDDVADIAVLEAPV